MSRPLFLVDALPAGDRFVLAGSEGHHAAGAQRLRPGERLLLGDGVGGTATAMVKAVTSGRLTLAIESRWYADPPVPRLVVGQAIAKGDRGELAVAAMTEVGVDEIVPWAASRCVAMWRGERGAKARDKWAVTAREAAKQARRAWLPVVAPAAVSTAVLAARPTAATLVLHEEAKASLTEVDLPAHGEVMLMVGPEGGISDAEIDTFTAAGARPVRLGDTILRTSTAGAAALAVLQARLRRW
jgi:16S rRNA (uracil1498-N3)-methyltransferase